MPEKFANKYRNESARLRNWDYGRNGKYFITLCTGNRECYFGDIKDKKVKLSEIGILADQFWLEIPENEKYYKEIESMVADNKNNLVEIFAGSSLDAEIVNSLLKDSDIESFLRNEHMGTIAPWQVSAGGAGAVKIIINSRDYETAKQIIENYERNKK